MLRIHPLMGALLLMLTASGVSAQNADDGAPAGSALRFVGKNLFATANGSFGSWRFTRIEVDPTDLSAGEVELEVDVASLDTGIARRDDHLRSEDFFEVERWPTARVRVFEAVPDGVGADGGSRYRAQFELTIRDVTKIVEGHFELLSQTPMRVRGEALLDRTAFGVGAAHSRWNPVSVRNEIEISFEAQLP